MIPGLGAGFFLEEEKPASIQCPVGEVLMAKFNAQFALLFALILALGACKTKEDKGTSSEEVSKSPQKPSAEPKEPGASGLEGPPELVTAASKLSEAAPLWAGLVWQMDPSEAEAQVKALGLDLEFSRGLKREVSYASFVYQGREGTLYFDEEGLSKISFTMSAYKIKEERKLYGNPYTLDKDKARKLTSQASLYQEALELKYGLPNRRTTFVTQSWAGTYADLELSYAVGQENWLRVGWHDGLPAYCPHQSGQQNAMETWIKAERKKRAAKSQATPFRGIKGEGPFLLGMDHSAFSMALQEAGGGLEPLQETGPSPNSPLGGIRRESYWLHFGFQAWEGRAYFDRGERLIEFTLSQSPLSSEAIAEITQDYLKAYGPAHHQETRLVLVWERPELDARVSYSCTEKAAGVTHLEERWQPLK